MTSAACQLAAVRSQHFVKQSYIPLLMLNGWYVELLKRL